MSHPGSTEWMPVVAVLGVGLAIGAVLVWRLRGGTVPAALPAMPLELRDLVGRRDALLQQLRELHELDEAPGPRRQALELEAAQVLLEIEDRGSAPDAAEDPAAAASPAAPGGSSAAQGFFWGLGTAGALAALLFFVSRQAAPREEGGSITGGFESGPAAAPAGEVDAALARARQALQQQDLMTVFNETQAVLKLAPGHPQALAYQSLVRLAMGQADAAEQLLKQALANQPDFVEGYVHLALVYARTGRMAEADRVLADAETRFPRDAELIRGAGAEIRAAASDGPAPAAAPPPARPDGVSGTVELAGEPPPEAVLFVTARAVGQTGGPPVAAKRLVPRGFPVPFSLGPGDSMMGQALPAHVRLEARLDSDGDPLTRPPTDPTAVLEDVALGRADVRLVLGSR